MSEAPPRAGELRPAGAWDARAAADCVVLRYDDRFRRRLRLVGEGGLAFLLDLERTVELRQGDGLVLEDGRIVEVRAAPEALLEIVARDPRHLLRITWHLGNRHLPTQILDGRLRIRADHVIEDMVRRLGAEVTAIAAPFEPEGGAYGEGRTHSHDHSHDHSHSHSHGHGHDHDDGHDDRHSHSHDHV